MSKLKPQNERRIQPPDAAFFLAFVCLLAYFIFLAPYGWAGSDEAFYVAEPYRFVQGDCFFTDDWNCGQLFAFVLIPLMKLRLALDPSTDGIILSFRYYYVAISAAVTLFIYLRTRRISPWGALFASLFLFVYSPLGIRNTSYNVMGLMSLALVCVLMLTAEKHPAADMYFAGIFIAVLVLNCPFAVAIYIIYALAVLYFLSLFIMVDLHAAKLGLSHGSDISISAKETFREGWHYMAAIVVLFVLLIVLELSPAKSSFFSIVTLLVCDSVKARIENRKVDFSRIYDVVIAASKSAVSIAAVTACAGIIIGCFNATGLNLRLSTMLIEIAGGSKLILLLLAAVGALILGMGLPATPVYILMAVMIAPALTASGIPKLAAHMFVFYFGAMAPITPPVGTAFYVTAGIAKSAPMKTGFTAWYMALVAFLVPFVWVYEPAFLLIGTVPEIIWTVITCTIGTVALAFGLEGYMLCRVSLPLRIVLIAAAIMMVIPERISTVIGLAVILAVLTVR